MERHLKNPYLPPWVQKLILLPVCRLLFALTLFCSCTKSQKIDDAGHSAGKTDSGSAGRTDVAPPEYDHASTTFSDSAELAIKEFPVFDSLLAVHPGNVIKPGIAKVQFFRQAYSEDSLRNFYKISFKSYDFAFEQVIGRTGNNRNHYIGGHKLKTKVLASDGDLVPDSLGLQVDYALSHFYTIEGEADFVLIVSKSQQWTGRMSSLSFCQLISLDDKTLYEFINVPF